MFWLNLKRCLSVQSETMSTIIKINQLQNYKNMFHSTVVLFMRYLFWGMLRWHCKNAVTLDKTLKSRLFQMHSLYMWTHSAFSYNFYCIKRSSALSAVFVISNNILLLLCMEVNRKIVVHMHISAQKMCSVIIYLVF